MPSTRRLISLGGAAFVGLAASALLIAPASAHTAALSLDHKCADNGSVKVVVTVTNDWNTDATLRRVDTTPALKKIKDGATVGANNGALKESVSVPAGTKVSVSFLATWADGHKQPVSDSLDTGGLCGQPCPPSITTEGHKGGGKGGKPQPSCPPTEGSPSPSPSGGGEGGGAGSPTPSASDTTPTLPKTGAQTSYIAGGAVVLLGAGTGLFFLARRRRVKFEA